MPMEIERKINRELEYLIYILNSYTITIAVICVVGVHINELYSLSDTRIFP